MLETTGLRLMVLQLALFVNLGTESATVPS